jgi:hypothetical protein
MLFFGILRGSCRGQRRQRQPPVAWIQVASSTELASTPAGRTSSSAAPIISIMLILVEMISSKFNLFQHIFNLEFQFISTSGFNVFQLFQRIFGQKYVENG